MKITRHTPFDELPQLLTPAEIMAYTGLSRTTVYALLASGELPARRFGRAYRVPKEALRGVMDDASPEPEAPALRLAK